MPGLIALRIEGGLYTMNVRGVQAEILDRVDASVPPPTVVLVDVGGTFDTSVTVIDVFAETDQLLTRRGIDLWVAAIPSRALEKASRLELWTSLVERGKVHTSVAAAVVAYERRPAVG